MTAAFSALALSPTHATHRLTYVNASRSRLRDITGLAHCKDLTVLNVTGTPLSNISALSACTRLELLHLSDSQVTDLKPLKACTNLTTLQMRGCKVRKIPEREGERLGDAACRTLFPK